MSDRPSPWNLGGLTLRELGSRVWNEIGEDEVTDRAAALAYYFLFALFPTLLFLTVLLGLLPLPGLMDRLLQYMDQALPGDAASIVRRTWTEIYARRQGRAALDRGPDRDLGLVQRHGLDHDRAERGLRRRGHAALVEAPPAGHLADLRLRNLHPGRAGPPGVRPPHRRRCRRAVRARYDVHLGLEHRQLTDRGVLRAGRHRPRLLPGPRRRAALALGDSGIRSSP